MHSWGFVHKMNDYNENGRIIPHEITDNLLSFCMILAAKQLVKQNEAEEHYILITPLGI